MKFSVAALSATLVAIASGAAAQLDIISPGGPNLWWGQYVSCWFGAIELTECTSYSR